ncbi:TPA: helix-turn-helix domain-containing protein [Serratia marcescens]
MNTMVKIALFDENRYFSAGWQEALALHFSTYGKRTLLVDARQVHEADLVFCYFPPGVKSCFGHLFDMQNIGRKTLYFSLRKPKKRFHRVIDDSCGLEAGVIYHNMPLDSALHQVSTELELGGKWPDWPSCGMNCVCQHRGLTLREQEIMRWMAREMGVRQIARLLDISVKTVSNHKMSVMRKMGFRRNAELYSWLRWSSGSDVIKERMFSRKHNILSK